MSKDCENVAFIQNKVKLATFLHELYQFVSSSICIVDR